MSSGSEAAGPRERARRIVAEVLGTSAGSTAAEIPAEPEDVSIPGGEHASAQEPAPAQPVEPTRSAAGEAAHRIVLAALAAQAGAEEVEAEKADDAEDAEDAEDAGPPPLPAALRASGSTAMAPPDGEEAGTLEEAEEAEEAEPLADDASAVDAPASSSDQDAAAIARELVAQVLRAQRHVPEPEPAPERDPEPEPEAAPAPEIEREPEREPEPIPAPAPVQAAPEDRMRQLFAAPTLDADDGLGDDEPELVDGTDAPWDLAGDLTSDKAAPSRSGRWLLATILGAIALALLFPLAVAALRQVLALS